MNHSGAIHGNIALEPRMDFPIPVLWIPGYLDTSDGQKGTEHTSGWKADLRSLTAAG